MYAVFDKDSDGYISTPELGAVMRALGQNPSEAEIKEFATEYDGDGKGERLRLGVGWGVGLAWVLVGWGLGWVV